MSFEWTDRQGHSHILTNPAPIVTEAETIMREIDRLIPGLENADGKIREAARRLVAPLVQRLEKRNADLERWNAHAHRQTLAAAAELIERIAALPSVNAAVTLVVALHDEHDQLLAVTNAAPQTRTRALADRMTAIQRRAFMAIDIQSMPPETMTRGEARAALDALPRFARRHADAGGWFAWADRDGHAHRLVDPLPMERETVAIAGELAALLPSLRDHDQSDALFTAVQAAATRWERLTILKQDLERFGREEEVRNMDDCRKFAADWRSKRSK